MTGGAGTHKKKYISQKTRNKANKGFSGGSEKLKEITTGADKTLKKIYGKKYRMNTKSAGEDLGLKKKHQPK
jgi:hypothetical protein